MQNPMAGYQRASTPAKANIRSVTIERMRVFDIQAVTKGTSDTANTPSVNDYTLSTLISCFMPHPTGGMSSFETRPNE